MRALITLVLLGAAGAGGWYAWKQMPKEESKLGYLTAEAKRGPITATVMATGTVEPLVKVLVGSQVSGTVTKWYVDFNDTVKESDLLAELDQDSIKATIAQRKGALAAARARLEEAKARQAEAELELQRIDSAFKRAAASSFELDTTRISAQAAEAATHAAQAGVEQSEADLLEAQIQLDRHIIRSPIDGVVISRDIDAGQTVAASLSAPTLFTIANDLTKMRVNAAVSETDVGAIKAGMTASFRVDAYPERRFRGVVSQVRYAEKIEANVVTYETLVDVENPDLLLRPGMTATITFEIATAPDVLMVPNAALRFDPAVNPAEINWRVVKARAGKPRIFKLVNGEPVKVDVELGIRSNSFTEVRTDELASGDAVVVDWDLSNLTKERPW